MWRKLDKDWLCSGILPVYVVPLCELEMEALFLEKIYSPSPGHMAGRVLVQAGFQFPSSPHQGSLMQCTTCTNTGGGPDHP